MSDDDVDFDLFIDYLISKSEKKIKFKSNVIPKIFTPKPRLFDSNINTDAIINFPLPEYEGMDVLLAADSTRIYGLSTEFCQKK